MIEGKIFECPACGSEEYFRCEHDCGTKICIRCSCEYHYFENRITRGHKPICGLHLPSVRSSGEHNYADQYDDDEDLPELVARDEDNDKKEEKKQASVEEQNRWDNGPDDDLDGDPDEEPDEDPDEIPNGPNDLPDESDEKINYEDDIPTVEEVEAIERSIVTTRRS